MGRPDGRLIKSLPPFTKIIPYIMPRRYDATNFVTLDFPYDKITAYINKRKRDGTNIPMMACILAAYIRTIAKYPETNRFIISKKIYARKGIWISFVTLKDNWSGEGEQDETVSKLCFNGYETIDEVSGIIRDTIAANRTSSNENAMDKLLKGIFAVPALPSAIVSILKCLDKFGLLPRSVIDASPFHTSVFFTNMASIRSYPIYHHLYDFGTTGAFLSLGIDINNRKQYQIKAATDERLCSGSTYVRAMHYFLKNMRHLESLEISPTSVNEDLR